MAEYVNKAEALKEVIRFSQEEGSNTVCSKLYSDIGLMPTIEIPEEPHFETEAEGIAYLVGAFSTALDIVHCSECIHAEELMTGKWCCDISSLCQRGTFFCADGERNEDG